MAILWQSSPVPFIDPNGNPYSGARVFFFDANTTTPRIVFKDAGFSQPHDHPVVANASGMFPAIFLPAGDYRQRIEASTGVTISDIDGISTPSAGSGGGGGGGDTDPTLLLKTGMLIDRHGKGAMAGWVRAAGRSIGNASSAATERANADCENLFVYLWTEDPSLSVSGGRGATATGDFAAGKRIDLPDLRLRARVGLADMGNAVSTLIADATIDGGETTTTLGATTGASTVAISIAQMPSHNHGGVVGDGGSHSHTYQKPTTPALVAQANFFSTFVNDTSVNTSTAPNHNHSINSQGGGAGHANVQPSALITVYIKL